MKQKKELSKGAASGIVALIFLVLGFQVAMFVTRFTYRVTRDEQMLQTADHQKDAGESVVDGGDDIPKSGNGVTGASGGGSRGGRTKLGGYPAPKPNHSASGAKSNNTKRELPKPFEFDPNSVTLDQLVELGFSERQAEVIMNYRAKGGTFRKKEDFAKMYVVSEAMFERLKPYINIPKVELNGADSAALVSLHGIGPYYAKKIIAYRERLGGFYSAEQLLEIDGMDEERFAGLKEYIDVDSLKIKQFPLWELHQDSIAAHPYIGAYAAKGIVRYRSVCDTSQWTVAKLVENGIITPVNGAKLSHYLTPPS